MMGTQYNDDMDAPAPGLELFPEGEEDDISDSECRDSMGGRRESAEGGRLTSRSSSITPEVTCQVHVVNT